MNLKTLFYAVWARPHKSFGRPGVSWTRRAATIQWLALAACSLSWGGLCDLSAATVPPGFTETVIDGPIGGNWNEAVGVTFAPTGRMFVWERAGRVWFKDPSDVSFSLLLDIHDEVGDWGDYGCVGFALDPEFEVNGYIYLLYVVDRYYLFNYGLPNYDPNANEYNAATIGRLTRYTCRSSDGFRSVDLASRFILIGQTKETGFPHCSDTHGVGSLVFGQDGTLLVSCGDGASAGTADVGGPAYGSFAPQALADHILRPKEDIGAFRSQLVDCLNGKVLRIDPTTGNGLPSNPFYDSANPTSTRSKVWALGLRNPFRMTLRPETGSHDPADGNPGILYAGDVGWDNWESLKVVTAPGKNFGWPLYEGLQFVPIYDQTVFNLDASNPLYPGSGCSQYFSFKDLLKEDTLNPAEQPPFRNPCNSSQRIPSSIPQFLHSRPVLDWNHASTITRTPIYGPSGEAQTANVGDPGSPVSGTQFRGNCSIGGTWYTGMNFPAQYQNTYFHADWDQGWMKNFIFDENDKPVAVNDFVSAAGAIVCLVQHPLDGSLYYVTYNYGDAGTVRKLSYTGNRTPVAVASANKYYGPSPMTVQFSSSGSIDPDGGPLTYSWNFGDGSPLSNLPNPSHVFSAPGGVPTKFTVILTVTDSGGLTAQETLILSANDTPPNVTITSPIDGALYSPTSPTTVNLTATVSDLESIDSQLTYQWQTLLHHNDHNHLVGLDANHATTTVLSPIGCDGINIYYYRVILTVTDPTGLSTTREVRLFPDCGTPDTPPVISGIQNQTVFQDRSTAPLAFTVGDAEVAAANLQLSASSSNPALVPIGDIVFGGFGSNRTVTVTPGLGQTGTATITVTVNDGPNNTSTSFVLTVNPAPPGTATFNNTVGITIPDSGAASSYPSYIDVTGLGGTVSNVTLTLKNLSHTWTRDVNVLLVGPAGQKMIAMSDTGNGGATNVTLTLSDAAASGLPLTPLTTGTFRPADYPPTETFPAPAPAGPYATNLSAFNGQSANGAWALYVFDDGPGDQGIFAGGWSLTVTTVSSTGASPTITDIPDQFTTINTPTNAIPFTINDADTPLGSLTLSTSSSNLTLVPSSNIVLAGSGANRTVTVTPAAGQTGTATITVTVSDGVNSASDSFLLTVTAANTPPMISDIGNQTINEDTTTSVLNFTVGDAETSAANLTVSASSSNPTLVPNGNIVFGGSGANRTVTMTPAANQNGTSTITVSVSDGQLSASDTFVVTVNAVNDPPTISNIPNQTTTVGTATPAIPFTVGDVEKPPGSLAVSGSSSNTTLVPNGNIVFSGSGANRKVKVTPAAGQTGTATITVSVSDGQLSASTGFLLTVTAGNTPPTITQIAAQTINEDTATGAIAFKVKDAETAAASLTVTGSSSNPTLVPNGNIVFGGSTANRTVRVTPATNQNGTATITVSVSDGQLSASASFVLTVNAVNDAPTISSIADQTTTVNTPVGPVSFTVGDIDTPLTSLTLSGSSSNPVLVPNTNIVFAGSGASRTVTITPAAGQTGTATITVTVSDGSATASTSFVLTVNPATSGGLVAAYHFNEGSGATVADSSGNGNTGTINGATWTTLGKYGSALSFNGTSNLVVVNSSASLNFSSAMTLEAWVYPTANQSGWRTIVQREVDAYFLHASSTSPLRPAGGGTFNGTVSYTSGSSAITVNAWTHLAQSYDGATLRLYVNGTQVASQAVTGSIETNSNALRIGGNVPYGEYFKGRIDEVRIYSRALSAAEIQTDMNTP